MKLLLDTHIWLWSFLEPDRIGRRIAALLDDPTIEKWLSPISVWEFFVLAEKGRLKLTMTAQEWVVNALQDQPVREAPLTMDVVRAVPTIRLRHRDPADAFLIATAKVLDLTFVTADRRLLSLRDISVLANR